MTLDIYFEVSHLSANDEEIVLMGNIPELGSWKEDKAVPLIVNPTKFPLWNTKNISVTFPLREDIEYIYAIKRQGKVESRANPIRLSPKLQENLANKYDSLTLFTRAYQCSDPPQIINGKIKKEYIDKLFHNHVQHLHKVKTSPLSTAYTSEKVLKIYSLPIGPPKVNYGLIPQIYPNSAVAQISDDRFFVCGGGPKDTSTSFAGIFNAATNHFEKTSGMLVPRKAHQLGVIFAHTTYVYAVGGIDYNYLNTCEKYDELHDTWKYSANLNEYKKVACVMPYQNRFLYAFGGRGFNTVDYKELNSRRIERLDICSEEAGWVKIDVTMTKEIGKDFWAEPLIRAMFRPVNSQDIMILKSSGKVLTWNITKSEITLHKAKNTVNSLEPIILEDKGYIFFPYNDEDCRTCYSHYKKKWEFRSLKYSPFEVHDDLDDEE